VEIDVGPVVSPDPDGGFRVVAANQTPDHTTLSRFLKEHAAALANLFTQGLELCAKAGLVNVGVVALDGSKMKANAGLSANRKYGAILKESRGSFKRRLMSMRQKTKDMAWARRGTSFQQS
jgi:hypothetical protein